MSAGPRFLDDERLDYAKSFDVIVSYLLDLGIGDGDYIATGLIHELEQQGYLILKARDIYGPDIRDSDHSNANDKPDNHAAGPLSELSRLSKLFSS